MPPAMRLSEKIGYGLGDAACSMLWKLFSVYLMFFYTDICGLDAWVVGLLFLVTRVWDSRVRPDAQPLGNVPSVAAVGRAALRSAGGAHLLDAGLERRGPRGLCRGDLLGDDGRLFAGQRPLRLAAGGHLLRCAGAHDARLLPHGLRRGRQHPGRAAHRAAGAPLRR